MLLLLLGILGVRQNRRPAGPHHDERRFTASPAQTYAALAMAVRTRFNLHNCDHSTMRIRFGSGISLFTWGETFTAQVTPVQSDADGAFVRVTGVGNVSTLLLQASRLSSLTQRLFTDIATLLDSGTSQAKPRWPEIVGSTDAPAPATASPSTSKPPHRWTGLARPMFNHEPEGYLCPSAGVGDEISSPEDIVRRNGLTTTVIAPR